MSRGTALTAASHTDTKDDDSVELRPIIDPADTMTRQVIGAYEREDEPLLSSRNATVIPANVNAIEDLKYTPSKREKLVAYLCFLILGVRYHACVKTERADVSCAGDSAASMVLMIISVPIASLISARQESDYCCPPILQLSNALSFAVTKPGSSLVDHTCLHAGKLRISFTEYFRAEASGCFESAEQDQRIDTTSRGNHFASIAFDVDRAARREAILGSDPVSS